MPFSQAHPTRPRSIKGTHTYAYDALGRRVSKSVDTNADNIPDVTTVFVCAGQQVIAEYDGGAAPGSTERKYIFCATGYIDEAIAMIDASGSGEDTYYYHRNRQFSIIGLTDDTGTVIERYAYTAYGEVTVLDASAAADADNISDALNPYTYTGRRLDDETGLLYFRARYHDPVLGRFLERDPLGYPDGLNTYAAYYVMWGGVDPTGMAVPLVLVFAPAAAPAVGKGIAFVGSLAAAWLIGDAIGDAINDSGGSGSNRNNRRRKGDDKRVKCEGLYQAYKAAIDAYSKKPCKHAKTCAEVAVSAGLLATVAAKRAAYIAAGCDKVDWGTGTTTQQKREKHWGEYRSVMRGVENCWEKYDRLGCGKSAQSSSSAAAAGVYLWILDDGDDDSDDSSTIYEDSNTYGDIVINPDALRPSGTNEKCY